MALNGDQRRQLKEALLAAFPDEAGLAQVVRYGLDQNLAALVGSGVPLDTMIFRLVEWVSAQERVGELMAVALAANPQNTLLQTVAAAVRQAAGQPAFR